MVLLGRLGRVADHALQHGEILEEAAASGGGEAAGGLGPVAVVALADLDEARLLQHLEMAAEIAVREAAELLQVGEGEPLSPWAMGVPFAVGQGLMALVIRAASEAGDA